MKVSSNSQAWSDGFPDAVAGLPNANSAFFARFRCVQRVDRRPARKNEPFMPCWWRVQSDVDSSVRLRVGNTVLAFFQKHIPFIVTPYSESLQFALTNNTAWSKPRLSRQTSLHSVPKIMTARAPTDPRTSTSFGQARDAEARSETEKFRLALLNHVFSSILRHGAAVTAPRKTTDLDTALIFDPVFALQLLSRHHCADTAHERNEERADDDERALATHARRLLAIHSSVQFADRTWRTPKYIAARAEVREARTQPL